MLEKKRRERGATLEPEQRAFIDTKLHEECLSLKSGAAKYQIAERTLRNALNGKPQDRTTLEEIIDRLEVPDVNHLKKRHQILFHIPRERNAYFIGREDRMSALCQTLEQSRFTAVTQALSGMGGIGKTSTAVEYAYRCQDKANYPDYPQYKTIQFARADTVEVLKREYVAISDALRLRRAEMQNPDQAVQAVLHWMTLPVEAPWLLILDNADDPTILGDFLPQEPQRHHGHILITSRSHNFANRIKRLDIEALDEEEGVTFLYHRTGRERLVGSKEEQAVRTLVLEMGGLPLALEQAAAYMTQGQVMSFKDYLANYHDQKVRSKQMMHAPEYGFYRQFQPQTQAYTEAMTVLTTWKMSLESIAQYHPESVELLRLCAFLHPVGIPRELVVALLSEFFAPAVEDIIQQNMLYNGLLTVLMRYSLIQRDLDNATHSVHVLVQTVLRDELPSAEQREIYERILGAINISFPSEDYVVGGRGALYYLHAERICNYTKQVGLESKAVALLLTQMGDFMDSQGRFEEAESLYTQALSMQQKLLSAEHCDIATSLSYLSELYRKQRRFSEAELLSQQVLEMHRKILPSDHPDIASILNNMALLCLEQGRVSAAEILLKQSLAMWRKLLPLDKDRFEMAKCLGNLAIVYQRKGHFEEAEAFFKEELALSQTVLPEGHPEIAKVLNNLAVLYWRQNRFAEAEPLNLQALDIWRKSLPLGHPDIALGLMNLGVLYRKQGRVAEAEPLLKEVLAMWRQTFPEGHPEIGTCLNNLAMIHDSQDRFAEAEPLYLQGLAMWRKTLPGNHPDIALSLNHIAAAYQRHGRFAEAELLMKEAAEILRPELDTEHTD